MMNKFVSLRTKLLVGFTFIFSISFISSYYWFYRFTLNKTINILKSDLEQVATTTATKIDSQTLINLRLEATANEKGTSDDPRFQEQLTIIEEVQNIVPKIKIFTFTYKNLANFHNKDNPEKEIIYLVNGWANINLENTTVRTTAKFLESAVATKYHNHVLETGEVTFRDFYEDKWGFFITIYIPLKDSSGNIIAGLGADIEGSEIVVLRNGIRRQILLSFLVSYPLFLFLVYSFIHFLTNRINLLRKYALSLTEGGKEHNPILFNNTFFPDEKGVIVEVLDKMKENIEKNEQLLDGVFNQVAVGIAVKDLDCQILKVNQTLCNILGYTEEDLLFKNCLDIVFEDDVFLTQEYIEKTLALNTSQPTIEKRCICKNGDLKWVGITMTLIKDKQGQPKYFISVIQDITARYEAQQKLIESAYTDNLTKLPNRTFFMEHLDNLLEQAQENSQYMFAVLLIDLDNFKIINDTLGHLAGDNFLIQVAKCLRSCLRGGDIVARLGGDEFVILLPSMRNLAEIVGVAQRILSKFKYPFNVDGQEFFSSASIGIALSQNQGTNTAYSSSSNLLRDADIAMYEAKHKGKFSYEVFDRRMYLRVINKLKLENELRSAIDNDELELYYQPIINLKTGNLSSIESLVRWTHRKQGLLSPSQFLNIAEEAGLMTKMGYMVLKKACGQLLAWQNEDLVTSDITISVNVAGQQIQHDILISQVSEVLSVTNLPAHNLRLELTETVISENFAQARKILEKVKQSGVRVSIDDFGTGYSSLARLQNFPIDQLKIDKSFIDGLNHDLNNTRFIKAILTLCENLELDAVCEGIETEYQKSLLIAMNCHSGQGYYWSKPMSAKDFVQWAKALRSS